MSIIKVDKVNVIGYDPVEGDMERRILEATDMRTNCKVTLLEVTGKLKNKWDWFFHHQNEEYEARFLKNQQIYQAGDKTKEYYQIIYAWPQIMEKARRLNESWGIKDRVYLL